MQPVPIQALSADPQSGCTRGLVYSGGKVVLRAGGCEFGDWLGFFSQDKCGGTRVEILERSVEVSETRVSGLSVVALPLGRYRLEFEDALVEGEVRRRYRLESLGSGGLGDFVLRSGAPREQFPTGLIAGRRLAHAGRNRMYQWPVRLARLEGAVGLDFELTSVEAPARLGVYTYLRDEGGGDWIMHHRLLTEPRDSDEYILRARYSAFSSRDHGWVKPLRHILWRFCERHAWMRPTFQVGGAISTRPGERWTLEARIGLYEAPESNR